VIENNKVRIFQRVFDFSILKTETPAGQFCLLTYWLVAGILALPSGFPIPSKNCPEAF
jgi:hypothetical protein